MIIKTNSHDITVSSVVSTTINKNGKTYDQLVGQYFEVV